MAAGAPMRRIRAAFLLRRFAMDQTVIICGSLAVACLAAAYGAWRDREHKYDVALLGITGSGLGIGMIAAAAT